MNINITEYKKVEIDMKQKMLESIETFGENIEERVTTPASIRLLIANEQSQQIDEEKSKGFHYVVVKLLYIMRRERPDLETAISLLCRRVSKNEVDNWKKLKRVLSWAK